MLRNAHELIGTKITDAFRVSGVMNLMLDDGTCLSVWCDEEQNAPGALYSLTVDQGGDFVLVVPPREIVEGGGS